MLIVWHPNLWIGLGHCHIYVNPLLRVSFQQIHNIVCLLVSAFKKVIYFPPLLPSSLYFCTFPSTYSSQLTGYILALGRPMDLPLGWCPSPLQSFWIYNSHSILIPFAQCTLYACMYRKLQGMGKVLDLFSVINLPTMDRDNYHDDVSGGLRLQNTSLLNFRMVQ